MLPPPVWHLEVGLFMLPEALGDDGGEALDREDDHEDHLVGEHVRFGLLEQFGHVDFFQKFVGVVGVIVRVRRIHAWVWQRWEVEGDGEGRRNT